MCFGTENASSEGLETFRSPRELGSGTPSWRVSISGLLYERQFKKLAGKDWQEAFTTTEERKQAERLLKVCTRKAPKVADIQEGGARPARHDCERLWTQEEAQY